MQGPRHTDPSRLGAQHEANNSGLRSPPDFVHFCFHVDESRAGLLTARIPARITLWIASPTASIRRVKGKNNWWNLFKQTTS